MTADVLIGPFQAVKPTALKWSTSVNNYSDTATVKLPAICVLKSTGKKYEKVQTGLQMKEGMAVEIYAGYNSENLLQFKGFIRRINFTVPLELECEGYSYQLRKKEGYTKSYQSTSLKQVLIDLIEGTDIKLSNKIPDVPLKNIYFKNVKGTDVLEYLKDKCLLTIYFDFDTLYAGLQMLGPGGTVALRLGWNVIKDNELKFEAAKELATVNIQLEKRLPNGERRRARHGVKDGAIKKMRISNIEDEAVLKQIAEEKRKELVYRGYEGKLTCFLFPYAAPGMAANISDGRYPERTGKYFIEGVDGEFSSSGGRQKINIGASL